MSKKGNDQITTVSEKKVYVVLAVIHFVIALIIIGVNLYFRFTDVHRGDSYEYVDKEIENIEVDIKKLDEAQCEEVAAKLRKELKG